MDSYDLADEVFRNIGMNENHEISLNDTIGSLNKKINEIETKMQLIDEKLDKIIDCPEKFIVVKQG